DNVTYNTTWLSAFGQSTPTHYLFASATDTGDEDAIWHTTNANASPSVWFPEFTSYDFEPKPVDAVFTTLYGSWMGDWNARSLRDHARDREFTNEDGSVSPIWPYDSDHPVRADIIRAALASDGDTLVSTLYS